jgi:Raf kinase inhibitor-like YbhB/YbcL family protein
VLLLTTTCLLLMAASGCRSDGRTLRPARADQNVSISAPATDDPTFVDPDAADSTLVGASSTMLGTLVPPSPTLELTAPWADGEAIDPQYTCDGLNVAPALSWSAAPVGTVEIAITLTDLDAPQFGHWVVAGLAPDTVALEEDTVPISAYEATNGAGDLGYTGPCPPAGTTHDYVVAVHYLGAATGLDDGSPAQAVITAITAAETASAEVTGTFSRI